MLLEGKQRIVQDLHGCFERAEVVILTDYKGLNVGALTELRRRLKEVGVDYRVVKNSLLERAVADTPASGLKDAFRGPNAVALSYEDPVAPAKVLAKFAKENDKFEIRSGVLAGKVLSEAEIKDLAELPSREVLLARLLGVFNAVPASFVRVLNAVPGGLVNVLNAVKESKESKEAA